MSTMTNEVPQVITASDGVQLEYEVLGEGEPLVILHGVFAGRGAFSVRVTWLTGD